MSQTSQMPPPTMPTPRPIGSALPLKTWWWGDDDQYGSMVHACQEMPRVGAASLARRYPRCGCERVACRPLPWPPDKRRPRGDPWHIGQGHGHDRAGAQSREHPHTTLSTSRTTPLHSTTHRCGPVSVRVVVKHGASLLRCRSSEPTHALRTHDGRPCNPSEHL